MSTQTETILKRIESILLRIALQLDCELDDAEKSVAVLRKTRRHPCARLAAETGETGP